MNLAAIIGVSDYTNFASLPACKNDANVIREVLTKFGAFDDVLFITSPDTKASDAKKALSDFVSKHKGQHVDSVVFYFSGHGTIEADDFLYVFSDYDDARRSQSALTNKELDGFLRALAPAVTAKIIDACHAGVQYIKDASGMQTLFSKGVQGAFSSVYFLFSSSSYQSSFADAMLSDFTRSIVNYVLTTGTKEIRYKDVIDFVTDDFRNNADQKPYFVIQADNTDIFLTVDKLSQSGLKEVHRALLGSIAPRPLTTPLPTPASKESSLASRVKQHSNEYLSDEKILEVLKVLQKTVSEHAPPADIAELFNKQVSFETSYKDLPRISEIGKWLADNRAKNLFAEVTTETVERLVHHVPSVLGPRIDLTSVSSQIFKTGLFGDEQPKLQKVIEVSGFNLAFPNAPYKRILVTLTAKFVNTPSFLLGLQEIEWVGSLQ